MKKYIFLLFIFSITLSISKVFACPLPPDFIHEFFIDTTHETLHIRYTLSTWENLQERAKSEMKEVLQIPIENEHIQEIADAFIIPYANLSLNNQPINLTFLTGSIQSLKNNSQQKYLPQALLTIEFDTNISHLEETNDLSLVFSKTFFGKISPLIHAYIFTDIQKDGEERDIVYNKADGKYFIEYLFQEKKYTIDTSLEEETLKNTFHIFINKNNENTSATAGFVSQKPKEISDVRASGIIAKIRNIGSILEPFFSGGLSWQMNCLGIIVALVFGSLHALLPGHSKSLIGTYVIQKSHTRTKDIFLIISSVTFSHTFFLLLLAAIILFLHQGIGSSSSWILLGSGFFYILFGCYFLYASLTCIKNIYTKKAAPHHEESSHACSCHSHKKEASGRATIISGLLAGCNPCIDALALFLFALSVGNGGYAFCMIVVFSIGMGLTLGIMGLFVAHTKMYFERRQGGDRVVIWSSSLTATLGLIIVVMGAFVVLSSPLFR